MLASSSLLLIVSPTSPQGYGPVARIQYDTIVHLHVLACTYTRNMLTFNNYVTIMYRINVYRQVCGYNDRSKYAECSHKVYREDGRGKDAHNQKISVGISRRGH
jgi:hypothetical protein